MNGYLITSQVLNELNWRAGAQSAGKWIQGHGDKAAAVLQNKVQGPVRQNLRQRFGAHVQRNAGKYTVGTGVGAGALLMRKRRSNPPQN